MSRHHGLDRRQRRRVRGILVRQARLCHANRAAIHYTQGPRRWDGIRLHKRWWKGEYPQYADCSAFTTWLLWDATRRYELGDFVNGQGWRMGYTGSQVTRGRRVSLSRLKVGDLVFYGNVGGTVPGHVAMYIGGGLVVSHGSEAGPFIVPVRYRGDVHSARRYL